jgi:hypothetical protein
MPIFASTLALAAVAGLIANGANTDKWAVLCYVALFASAVIFMRLAVHWWRRRDEPTFEGLVIAHLTNLTEKVERVTDQGDTYNVNAFGEHAQAIGKQINLGAPQRTLGTHAAALTANAASVIPPEPVAVTCLFGDTEGLSFAWELTLALRGAGWTVEGVNQAVFSGPPMKGVVLRTTGYTELPWFGPVGNTLLAMGIQTVGGLGAEANDIVVGQAV